MSNNFSRREFIRTTSVAALAGMAAAPTIWAQDQKQTIIAFVGVGHIHTPGFVNLIKDRKDVKVKSVWDSQSARAEKTARELSTKVVKDADEIWSDPEIKAVIITYETNQLNIFVISAAK